MMNGMKTKELKEKLEAERVLLMDELKDIGTRSKETGEWEAVPEEQTTPETDENDKADRFENYEERTAMLGTLEKRLNDVEGAIKKMEEGGYGKCEVCGKSIEEDRLMANPAARTCMEHMNS